MKASRKRRSVLIVEDDPLNMELLQAVLEGHGFKTVTANEAESGIELARLEKPDVILMDIQLAEMDGLQATRVLRSDPVTSHIPIIAVTAHVKKEDRERCIEAGCSFHLPKPVDTRSLPAVVEEAIDSANAAGIGSPSSKVEP